MIYLDVECTVCGWKDGIRTDYWHPERKFWCDGCDGERTFKLVRIEPEVTP